MSSAPFTKTCEVARHATDAGFLAGRHSARVLENRQLGPDICRLVIEDAYVAQHAQPAQFINLYSSNQAQLLPRPFGVCAVNGDAVTLIFAVVGEGTAEFAQLQSGDSIDVFGPLGRPFTLQAQTHYILVGGGLGMPPLMYTAQYLQQKPDIETTAVLGYRDQRFADQETRPLVSRLESITNAQGNVVDLLNKLEYEQPDMFKFPVDGQAKRVEIISCGPIPMMKAVALWATRRGIPCQLSLEARMACGYGTCVACIVDTVDGRKKVCSEGPVFTAQEMGWQA